MGNRDHNKLFAGEGDAVNGVFTIERITFANDDTGYAVAQLLPADGHGAIPLTAVGVFGQPRTGQCYRIEGVWRRDARFGMQVKVSSAMPETPRSLSAIERYLAGASIKGLGPHYAKLLIGHFRAETFDELQNGGPRLEQVSGIGPVRAGLIRESWAEHQGIHDLMVNLQGVAELTPNQAQRVYRQYGLRAWQVVSTNPYQLAEDVRGFGFVRCDRIGRSLGIAHDAPQRIQAGILHLLGQALADGHLWSERNEIATAAAELLGVDRDSVLLQVDVLAGQARVISQSLEGPTDAQESLWLPEVARVEERIAERLGRFLRHPSTSSLGMSLQAAQLLVQSRAQGHVTDEQQEAIVRLLCGARVVILTGGPGTGKTTTVRTLIDCLERRHVSYALCATTGRAAKQLAMSTERKAATVHRHLGIGIRNRGAEPVREQVLIIDESSMIDIWLLDEIVARLRDATHLVLVGDVDQLPSVGPGAVLQDIIRAAESTDHDGLHVTRLTRIFRQEAGEQSMIVVNCHRVRQGERPIRQVPRTSDYFEMHRETPQAAAELAIELTADRLPTYLQIPSMEIQVLAPMHRGAAGVQALNEALQRRLNPSAPTKAELVQRAAGSSGETRRVLRVGDKVRQTQNNYQKQVFNGDLGLVNRIYRQERALVVQFDDRKVSYGFDELDQLVHAWAMTVHSAQGSQWPAVVVLFLKSHYVMLERNILYTALSRAQRLAVLVTQEQALRVAVGRDRSIRRRTYLVERLARATAMASPG